MIRRNTIQKELVLNAVRDLKRHVTADEIYEYISKSYPSIGKATVYRNLNILSQEGQIRRVEISDSPDIFDFMLNEHYHVKCVECGKVFDVDMNNFADMIDLIRDTHGFQFLSYDILFKGICPKCQKRKS